MAVDPFGSWGSPMTTGQANTEIYKDKLNISGKRFVSDPLKVASATLSLRDRELTFRVDQHGKINSEDIGFLTNFLSMESMKKISDAYLVDTGQPIPTNIPSVTTKFKYKEDEIVKDLKKYLESTYGEHYIAEDETVQCFDAWIALGNAVTSFRDTALKYLWRYGKKDGKNKKDLMKVLHYTVLMLYVDHYRKQPK